MTRLPHTTAVPDPSYLFTPPTSAAPAMSSATGTSTTSAGPEPTPLPPGATNQQPLPSPQEQDAEEFTKTFKLPKLRLIIEDLSHPGASRLLAAGNASSILAKSVRSVVRHLYQDLPHSIPGTRSVTLYLEDMDGVAYTTGSSLDNDHKEIHFSLRYINGVKKAPEGANGDVTGAYEIEGVLVHELVHCFQHNGRGTCPGGLIEGIADWVRLKANLGATHWKRSNIPERWDVGYEKTAFFLDWLETKYGKGSVRGINERLREEKYVESEFWLGLFGADVDTLWRDYVRVSKSD